MLELILWHHLKQPEYYACNGEEDDDESNSKTEPRHS